MMQPKNEVYIGDGVYASFEAGVIKLRTQRDSEHYIYLEPEVASDLVRYINAVWPRIVANACQ